VSAYKPKDLFLGVMDLFAVLLPGAVACFLFADLAARRLPLPDEHASRWVIFIVASYLIGHLLSLIGGAALDRLYDALRFLFTSRKGQQFGRGLQKRARDVLDKLLGDAYDKDDSAVKWSSAFIAVARPGLLHELERKEADQKMFRGLAIALAAAVVRYAVDGNGWLAGACGVFFALSLWRFFDQRKKYSYLNYWYLIALTTAKEKGLLTAEEAATPVDEGE